MKQLLLAAAALTLAACDPSPRPYVPGPPAPPTDPCEPVPGQFPTQPTIDESGLCPPTSIDQ